MEFKIIEKGTIKIVGLKDRMALKNNTIPQLWGKLLEREEEIANRIPHSYYGFVDEMECAGEDFSFDELAGVEVTDFVTLPEGMVSRIIPPYRYLIFTHKGPIYSKNGESLLSETYSKIYDETLPECGYEVEYSFNFEFYDSRFVHNSPDSEFDIYIPLKDENGNV